MIRQFLERLPKRALERVVKSDMRPGSYAAPCLVGAAGILLYEEIEDLARRLERDGRKAPRLAATTFPRDCVEARYDALCIRLGTARANDLVRAIALAILTSRQPMVVPTESKQLVHA